MLCDTWLIWISYWNYGAICLSVYLYLCICLCVAHSHSKNEFIGGQHHTTFPLLCPWIPILGQEVLKIHANINSPICGLNLCESLKFLCLLVLGNQGGGNMMVSDFRLEVERWPFHASCTLKHCNVNYVTIIYGQIAEISTFYRKSGLWNLMVRFQNGSRNMEVSCMHNENYAM